MPSFEYILIFSKNTYSYENVEENIHDKGNINDIKARNFPHWISTC